MKKYSYIVLSLLLASQLPAQAYLDPGTGSLFIQVIAVAFAGVVCWVKIQWNNIKSFFNKFSNSGKK